MFTIQNPFLSAKINFLYEHGTFFNQKPMQFRFLTLINMQVISNDLHNLVFF